MQFKILLLLTTSLVTAVPGNYHSDNKFQRSSSAFINDELQHKHEETSISLTEGETNHPKPAQVHSSYEHREYQKPLPQSDDGRRWVINRPLYSSGGIQRGDTGSSNYQTRQASSSYGLTRTYTPKPKLHPSDKLEELDDVHSTDFTRYQVRGFGRDYLENTEGQTSKPTEQPIINPIYPLSRQPGYGSQTIVHSPFIITPSSSQNEFKSEEDLSQKTEDFVAREFKNTENGNNANNKEYSLTQQSQVGFEDLEFGSQHQKSYGSEKEFEQDLAPQSQTESGKLEIRTQHRDSIFDKNFGKHVEDQHLIQQSQVSFANKHDGKHFEDLTQQTQIGFEKVEMDSHEQEYMTQQLQSGFGKLDFHSHNNEKQPDINEQSQISLGKLETEPEKHFEDQFVTQSQTGVSRLEFDSHLKDTTQQSQLEFGKLGFNSQINGKHFENEDLTQQSQLGFENLDYDTQHYGKNFQDEKEMTQQSEVGFGALQFGSQYQGKHVDQEMTQQSEVGFGTLEFGSQYQGKLVDQEMTQQSEVGLGTLEFGSQYQGKHIDQEMTQQSEEGFGTLEFGSQYQGKHINQDMTQKSELEFGSSLGHQQGPLDVHDMTQQFQVEFGKADFSSTHNGKHVEDQEHMTQPSQTGFGQIETGIQHHRKLEIGNYQETHQEKHFKTEETQSELSNSRISGSQNLAQKMENDFGHIQIEGQQKKASDDKIQGTRLNINHRQYSSTYRNPQIYSQQTYNKSTDYNYHDEIKPVFEEMDDLKVLKVEDSFIPSTEHNLNKSHRQDQEIGIETTSTTKKPGFWRRIGSSIVSTYETAKEKTINLADKVKHNLG